MGESEIYQNSVDDKGIISKKQKNIKLGNSRPIYKTKLSENPFELCFFFTLELFGGEKTQAIQSQKREAYKFRNL